MRKTLFLFCFPAFLACLVCRAPAAPEKPETPPIDLPAATIQKTFPFAYKEAYTANSSAPGERKRGRRPAPVPPPTSMPQLVSVAWAPENPDSVFYTFYLKDLESRSFGDKKSVPGTLYHLIEVTAKADFAHKAAPYRLTKIKTPEKPGGLLFGRDLRALSTPYKDIPVVTAGLHMNLSADFALGLRREHCGFAPGALRLSPRLELRNRAGSPPGFYGTLELSAPMAAPGAARAGKKGCGEYSGLDIFIEQNSGDFLVSDYSDGFVFAERAAGLLPRAAKGAGNKEVAISRLKRAFALMDSLFSASAGTQVRAHRALTERPAGGPPALPEAPVEEESFWRLDRDLTRERISELDKALKLWAFSPMAHAARGLLLTRECESEKPLSPDSCEKGLRALNQALDLDPKLAFAYYVLARRADSPRFPKKLRPLLKTDVPGLCRTAAANAPAWDWALHGTCALAALKRADAQSAASHLAKARQITVIRPGELLRRYLELE